MSARDLSTAEEVFRTRKPRTYNCVWLLGSLIGLFVLQPYLSVFSKLGIPIIQRIDSRMLAAVAYSVVLLLAVRAVCSRRKHLWIAIGLATPGFLLSWLIITLREPPAGMVELTQLFLIIFLAYVGIRLLIYVVGTRQVSHDQLAGAISIYLILGHLWSLIFVLIEFRSPGSFAGLSVSGAGRSELMYYSFVTLTTLGYGEITPVTLEARVFAALEAVVGVIYIATLVSRLVSLYGRRLD